MLGFVLHLIIRVLHVKWSLSYLYSWDFLIGETVVNQTILNVFRPKKVLILWYGMDGVVVYLLLILHQYLFCFEFLLSFSISSPWQ